MNLRISDIIQPRISHMKVVSKYVGNNPTKTHESHMRSSDKIIFH